MMNTLNQDAQGVLDYWFGDAITQGWPSTDRYPQWFHGTNSVDEEIQSRFGELVKEALDGGLVEWEQTPLGRLALVVLLDQFTRNMYRGRANAFAGDKRAQRLVQEALSVHEEERLPLAGRVFLYMPLEHAEDPELQDESVRRFVALADLAPPSLVQMLDVFADYALLHRDIIAVFGRFPHRNAALGRESTPREVEFLQDGPRFGQ